MNAIAEERKRREPPGAFKKSAPQMPQRPRTICARLAEFEALGLAFISLRDNLDLGTPAGRLMFQIIGAMAEFERALISNLRSRLRAVFLNTALHPLHASLRKRIVNKLVE
jgi:hypothetical protein